jgi:hypothetical protein
MTDQANPLAQFSDAIAARVEAATTAVVAISLAHERHITGMVCSSEVVVTSEQSLPHHDEFEVIAAGGSAHWRGTHRWRMTPSGSSACRRIDSPR